MKEDKSFDAIYQFSVHIFHKFFSSLRVIRLILLLPPFFIGGNKAQEIWD